MTDNLSPASRTATRLRARGRLPLGDDATKVVAFQLRLCREGFPDGDEHRFFHIPRPWARWARHALAHHPAFFPLIFNLGQLPAYLESGSENHDPVRGDTPFRIVAADLEFDGLRLHHIRRGLLLFKQKQLITMDRDAFGIATIRIRCRRKHLRLFSKWTAKADKAEEIRRAKGAIRLAPDAHI